MKRGLLDIASKILLEYNCKHIGEIGTHKGKTAVQFIELLCRTYPREKIIYEGYDVFDYAVNNPEFNAKEVNGKDGAIYRRVNHDLKFYSKKFKNLEYKLHRGFTTDTLSERIFDFVYIDGGHSYETVKHDYSKVKDSKVILFDDCQEPTVFKFTEELRSKGVKLSYIETGTLHKWGLIVNN